MTTAAVVPPSEPPLSQGARVINTFFAPSKTFKDINRSASWWLPFIITLLFTALMQFTVVQKVGADRFAENQFSRMPKVMDRVERSGQKPEDFMAQQAERAKRGWITAPIAPAIFILIYAALLLGSYNFGAGQHVKFKQCMAVVSYATLPGVLRSLLTILVAFLIPDTYNPLNPVATNLGYFMDVARHPFLVLVMSFLDAFSLWTVFLAALGFTQITKVKMGTSFAIVFGWFLIIILTISGLLSMVMG